MKYPATFNNVIHQRPWSGAGDVAFATWAKLVFYCSEMENGGRIEDAASWSDRDWRVNAGVSAKSCARAVEELLCSWDGSALVLAGYDGSAETAVERKRGGASKGGKAKHSKDLQEAKAAQEVVPMAAQMCCSSPLPSSPSLSSPIPPNPPAGGSAVESPAAKKPRKPKADVEYPAEFLAAWERYPRKVGKGAAARAWLAAKPPLQAVLEALCWQARSRDWTRDGGQFIPHFATYLNGRRWEDEPPHMASPASSPIGKAASVAATDDLLARITKPVDTSWARRARDEPQDELPAWADNPQSKDAQQLLANLAAQKGAAT